MLSGAWENGRRPGARSGRQLVCGCVGNGTGWAVPDLGACVGKWARLRGQGGAARVLGKAGQAKREVGLMRVVLVEVRGAGGIGCSAWEKGRGNSRTEGRGRACNWLFSGGACALAAALVDVGVGGGGRCVGKGTRVTSGAGRSRAACGARARSLGRSLSARGELALPWEDGRECGGSTGVERGKRDGAHLRRAKVTDSTQGVRRPVPAISKLSRN